MEEDSRTSSGVVPVDQEARLTSSDPAKISTCGPTAGVDQTMDNHASHLQRTLWVSWPCISSTDCLFILLLCDSWLELPCILSESRAENDRTATAI